MSMIPTDLYMEIESIIRSRESMLSEAETELMKARAKAFDISAPVGSGGGGKYRSAKSRVERAALQLEAIERKYEQAIKWMNVFRKLDAMFPEKSSVGFTASLMYGNGMSQEDVCRFTGASRQTVRRNRDKYVINAALIAAKYGLIEVEALGTEDQSERSSDEDQ